MTDNSTPIDIDKSLELEDYSDSEVEDDTLQQSDLDNSISNIAENLSNVGIEQTEKAIKRPRSNNTSMSTPNPTKKLKTLLGSVPTMSDVVKEDEEINGFVVDISTPEDKPNLTIDQNKELQVKITEALFAEEDISDKKFDDPPNFDGQRLRLFCSNETTKNWVVDTMPRLQDLWENVKLVCKVVGPPPKLRRSTIMMPAPTYQPPILFSIISAQNPGIDTTFWKYVSRTKVENHQQIWTIGVDENSVPALKEIKFKPHVGLSCIKISVSNQNI